MNYEAIEKGKHLLRHYYNPEAIAEMKHDFHSMHLPEEEFPAYVAYCYEMDNSPVDPHCF